MIAKSLILILLMICCNGLSIGTVSDQKVNKSKTSNEDYFPDWVPFKNKHGDELGTFVSVKNKVKKRLAPPFNFILRAVAEPESEDYYDKGHGGDDNDDNFESKDWSDLHRSAEPVNNQQVNLTDISDIEGVVDILKKPPSNSIIEAINNAHKSNTETAAVKPDENEIYKTKETKKSEEINKVEKIKKTKADEDDVDYDESSSENSKLDSSENVSDSEARKTKILDSVDELKERHAEESRDISKRVEEEMYKEEFERNRYHPIEVRDKYGNRRKYKKILTDYDEYEDKNDSLGDKYKVRPFRLDTTTQVSKKYPSTKKLFEHGKLSVFKNPQLYMLNEDTEHDVSTTVRTIQTTHFTAPLPDTSDERISLIPQDSKVGEPTLFLPKKRKSRRRKINNNPASLFRTETVTESVKLIHDTTAADSKVDTISSDISHSTAKANAADDVTGTDSDIRDIDGDVNATTGNDETTGTNNDVTGVDNDVTGTDNDEIGTDNNLTGTDNDEIGPDNNVTGTFSDVTASNSDESTAEDSLSTSSDDVSDAIQVSSDQNKEETTADSEKGGGQEHASEYDDTIEEEGKKAYEGYHEKTKTAKGHHDKDNHLGKYDDHGGVDKQHKEESEHYGNHDHEEHGKKHAQYEESGKHTKGHSTKGSHDVHKKDEYEKKVEFFEEDGDSAEEEKHGGFNKERKHSEGGKYKKDNQRIKQHYHTKGDSGYFGKGGHSLTKQGHKQSAGHDSHGKHGERHHHSDGRDGALRWIYHHGSPAQTANLVVIDRRGDQWYHGPRYYG